ncbi:flagellar basal body P-ring formation chaperone FlgA [Trichloromonas sp.]|uniref:flagellar basal body P-ring formation chaperone FlgA n=1 Tax=Trichloromonas sp. TaxID=3069249 RepID=UPI002A4650F6|nr:flagellar basal body P-ring formation chaperone FlgA [Trichloromonas sp.]
MPQLVPIALLLLFLFGAAGASGQEISLRSDALVADAMVTLGELAELDAETAPFAELQLMRSPEPGQERTLSAALIRQALLQRAPELNQATWAGAQTVTVRRDGLVIDQPALEKLLSGYLEANRERLPKARIAFKNMQFPPSFVLPKGKLATEVIPADSRILGSRRFTVIFRVDGQVVRNLSLRGELEALAPVVVAAADLDRGTILNEADLDRVEMDLTSLRNPCLDPDEFLGKKLKRPVRQGTPLDPATVEMPPVVSRGETVTILLRRGTLSLTARGQALQNGLRNETIRVRNNDSQRDISGRVVEPGVVIVEQ